MGRKCLPCLRRHLWHDLQPVCWSFPRSPALLGTAVNILSTGLPGPPAPVNGTAVTPRRTRPTKTSEWRASSETWEAGFGNTSGLGGGRSKYALRTSKPIDLNKSSLTIRVFKSGVFAAFAHDHEIRAGIREGEIDSSAHPTVQLRRELGQDGGTGPGHLGGRPGKDPTYDVRTSGSRCRAFSRNFLSFHRHNQIWGESLGGARKSDLAWKDSTSCGSGFFRERTLSRVGIFQVERFRHKPHTDRGWNRQG